MNDTWVEILMQGHRIFGYAIMAYVALSASVYIFMYIAAARSLWRDRDLSPIQFSSVLETELVPPLSIVVPAYNESINIVSSVRSLLGINYKQFEIVVVNDGSKDGTAEIMIEEFDMTEVKGRVPFAGLKRETKPIRAVYRSLRHPNLVLVDKENGGKADALNVGINVSRYPYFVSLDGDTVLDSDAFIKVVKPIMDARPGEEIIATGGSVGIANGSIVDSGYLSRDSVRLSDKPLVVMQVIEYLRGFLMGRIGLSRYNMLLLVSGAFGVFNKKWVVEAGGYETGTIGEDMELTVRLHAEIRRKKSKARIVYVPEPVCWTEAPESFRILRRQRTRWQRGLFESIWTHRNMILNPRHGRVGMLSMPMFLFIELLGPLVEIFGYATVIFGFFLDRLNVQVSLSLALMMLLFGSLVSTGAVLFEEWRFHNYNRLRDVFRLFFYALSESFWYRPVLTLWRTHGLFQAIRGKKHGWGEMTRVNVLGANAKKAPIPGTGPMPTDREEGVDRS
ncbi:glycosyltransferase family 2 protein [Saccharibacillus sacchari]|uniref:Glycosyltransferase family 2 protein n=1 Tax=Saccharibacillus sacchari TaxID=456493 RepID=A0ACC6PDK9_9BACL